MAGHSVLVSHILTAPLVWTKLAIALALIASPMLVQAAPADMGRFTIAKRDGGKISGSYTASGTATGSGSWGAFEITRHDGETNGYNGVSFMPTSASTGENGIEIKNESNTSTGQDKFKYTITITPHDNTAVHTIKIGQASYGTSGNSEVARQTLSYTPNSNINIMTKATVKDNPDVDYFYNAMGDYFMGKKLDGNSFSSANLVTSPQLRYDSSNGGNSKLYYYDITQLLGRGTNKSFTPTTTNGQVGLKANANGVLPSLATFANILKSTSTNPNNQSTYDVLPVNYVIANGSSYVSYGVENKRSNYVIEVKNAKTVTLTYEGIMNGSAGVRGDVVGETYDEWISFGVTSEPYALHKHIFSGTVFNDNGGISDAQANANTTGGIYNNNQYFNGIFDTSIEKGITGSTVSLVDKCVNPTQTYATQTLNATNASDIGKYELSVLSSTLKDQSSVCIVETYNSNTYPVQTTASTKLINLASDNYDNNNFGRVIAANAALVLKKYQHVHGCDDKFNYSSVSIKDQPTDGFSVKAAIDVEPGKCIAYKIEAINRANISIDDVVVTDMLQQQDSNNADNPKVTSIITTPNPTSQPNVPYSNSGQSGTIKTVKFGMMKRALQSFYFNTKYGTTQSD